MKENPKTSCVTPLTLPAQSAWQRVRDLTSPRDIVAVNPKSFERVTAWTASAPVSLFADRDTLLSDSSTPLVFSQRVVRWRFTRELTFLQGRTEPKRHSTPGSRLTRSRAPGHAQRCIREKRRVGREIILSLSRTDSLLPGLPSPIWRCRSVSVGHAIS
jgi:hypothetical protein